MSYLFTIEEQNQINAAIDQSTGISFSFERKTGVRYK